MNEPLIDSLKRHEGLRLKPYTCPAGKLTIAYGRNLDDVGVSKEEAHMLLYNDLAAATESADRLIKDGPIAPQAFEVLVHLIFWIGASKVANGFPSFLKAMRGRRYTDAANELLYKNPPALTPSKLFKDVPGRTMELVNILLKLEEEA